MSGHPDDSLAALAAEIAAEPITVDPKFVREDLTTQSDADVLIWCLRTLLYCQSNNSLYKLTKGRSSQCAFDSLKAACSSLEIPKSVMSLVDFALYAPQLIRKIKQLELVQDATERSVNAISNNCTITQAERCLLLFSIAINENELMENVFSVCLGRVSVARVFKVLSFVLDVPLVDIQAALRLDGFLARSGMLSLDTSPVMGLESRLDIGYGLLENLEIANGDWDKIIHSVCKTSRSSSLGEKDFKHMESEWSLVLGYIKGAANSGRNGANVLLYGPPGCGKTEFARAVIAASDVQGYELLSDQPSGESISSAGRRSYYRQANLYLHNKSVCVLLIDEMDGMLEINEFTPGPRNSGSSWSKASANAQLESNQVPSIWITNNPYELDSAQMRRFDLVVKFNNLSRLTIKSLLERKLSDYALSDTWMEAASSARGITPGLVETLSLVAASVTHNNAESIDMEELLSTALRQRGIRMSRKKPKTYRMEYCNASMSSDALITTLTAKHDARCLLYGSTGTGKTAFACHIAETLGLEAQLVRPSDILDMFVGGTERRIAQLFDQAVPEETLLVLDEFESYAADRSGAQRNWEVSQVNEMLSQLENYEGRVLACTNLLDYIDPAIRRRFQLKVEFMPMNESQRLNLFMESCQKLGLKSENEEHCFRRIRAMNQIAYGHVANAVGIAENLPNITAESFIGLLAQEIVSTNGQTAKPVGFLQ